MDLSRFLRGQVTLEDIRRAVIDDVAGKTWLAHPALPVLPEVEDVEDDELNNVYLRPTRGYTPIAPAVEASLLPPNWRENLSLQKDDPCLRSVKKLDSERPH